jgi:hypothetical protein
MPYIPAGKKSKRKAANARKLETVDSIIDNAVSRVRWIVQGRGLCLPMCVLLQRVLAVVVPGRAFHLRLGALNVGPLAKATDVEPIAYDPRGQDGIDGGFHAWLEDDHDRLLDPSILVTLHADGYDVDPESYLLDGRRRMPYGNLAMIYEELPELELLGVEPSEPALTAQMDFVLRGRPPTGPLKIQLDVGWRAGITIPHLPMSFSLPDEISETK